MDVATLGIKVDASGAITVLDQFGNKVEATAKKTDTFGKSMAKLGTVIGLGVIGRKFINETIQAQHSMAQLEAGVRSTGGAAGFSATQLSDMAAKMQQLTAYSDDAVMSAQKILLTFTQIRGDNFERATQSVADLATRMGTDLTSASIQVGKALNDPVRGVAALAKAGIQFTDQQKGMIKSLVQTGQMAKAQQVVLAELETQFGGSAVAARNTLGGALEALKNNFGDLFEVSQESSTGVIGALNTITDALPRISKLFGQFFGGLELMMVDLAILWNRHALDINNAFVPVWSKLATVMQRSVVPGLRDMGAALEANVHAYQDSSDATITALEAWRKEQYALIAGTNETAGVVDKLTLSTKYNTVANKEALDAAKKLREEREQNIRETSEAIDALKVEGDVRRRMIEAMQLGQEAVDELTIQLAGEAVVRDRVGKATAEQIELLRENAEANARLTITERELTESIAAQETARQKAIDTVREKYEEEQENNKQIRENAIRSMQEEIGKFYEEMFTKGLKSFGDLFTRIKQMFFQMLAQMLAAQTMKKLAGVLGGMLGMPATAAAQGGTGFLGSNTWSAQGKLAGSAIGGGMVGYGIGSMTTNRTLGGLGGAAGGAATGFSMGGPVGAAVGAVTGFIGGIIGSGKAARQAAREMERLQKSVKLSMEAYRANIQGDSLAQAIAQSRAALKQMLDQISDAYRGRKNEPERFRQQDIARRLQAEEEKKIRESFETQRRQSQEDLTVRKLIAEGRTKEAEAMALQLAQQREYADAVKAGADATYLATLSEVQRLEAIKKSSEELQTATRNAPSGVKLAEYIFDHADIFRGSGSRTIGGPRDTTPSIPMGKGGVAPQYHIGKVELVLEGKDLENPEQLLTKVAGALRQKMAATTGTGGTMAEALEYVQ